MPSRQGLRVLTWPDYAIGEVNRRFVEATGVDVVCEYFDSNEEAYQALRKNPQGYDVILADGEWPRHYLGNELIQPLNPHDFTGWTTVDPVFRKLCADQLWCAGTDRIAAYPGSWGVRGIVWDPAYVSAVSSWRDLWTLPKGSVLVNSQGSEVLAETALMLGYPSDHVYGLSTTELHAVTSELRKLARRLGGVWMLLADLVAGFGVGGTWAAEVHSISLVSNVEWACGRRLEFTVPDEGTVAYIDGAMISAATTLGGAAVEYIDYLFSPTGVRLQWEMSDGYPSTNQLATAMLRDDERFREKLERCASSPDLLLKNTIYQVPRDMSAYTDAWRSVLASVCASPSDGAWTAVEP